MIPSTSHGYVTRISHALSGALLGLSTLCAALSGCTSSDDGAPQKNVCSLDHTCPVGDACSDNAQCGGGRCDLGLGKCVECTVPADCQAGRDCVAGTCLSVCTVDTHCEDGQHCGSDNHCVECATDKDCSKDEHCATGACQADVCSKGQVDCDSKSGGLRSCSANGSSFDVTPCAASTSCVADAKGAACQPWLCSPGKSSCAPSGTAVRTCANDGLSFADETECDDGQGCLAGACTTIQCQPNRFFCSKNGSYLCSSDGASASYQNDCGAQTFCDEETGKCLPRLCTPGEKSCLDQSLTVGTCNADGSGYERASCAASEVCAGAKCIPLVCAPNEAFCAAGNVPTKCNSTGTDVTANAPCASGSQCVATATSATCVKNTCVAGTPLCVGTVATVCRADNAGGAEGGTDCAQTNGYCNNGKCFARVCTPYQRFCSGTNVSICSSDGSSYSLYSTCNACDPDTANCANLICTPNSSVCNGNKQVIKCDANGTKIMAVQDCAADQACFQGRCLPTVCTPYTYSCQNGNPVLCNATGTAQAVAAICTENTFCSNGSCTPDVCVAGAPVCVGNAVATCAADGSGPVGTGTPCASGSTCVNGACTPTQCTPYATFCANDNVLLCNASGTAASLYTHCFSDSYCAGGQCLPDVCANNAVYCSGETLSTCKSDGSGPISAGTDCASSGQVCTTAGCTSSAVDTFGPVNSSATSGVTAGQIILAQKSRKLTRVELRADLAQTAVKSTFVYSSADGVNFYLLANVAPAVTGNQPLGYIDSGPLSVQLQAGSYYLIGMNVSSTYLQYSVASSAVAPSFGTILKSVLNDLSAVPSSVAPTSTSTVVFGIRVTTTLP